MPLEHASQFRQGELANPGLVLDLSASPWHLGPNESRMILGRDVVHPARIAPDGGRKPVGCSLSLADRPITSVIECNFVGRVPVRWSQLLGQNSLTFTAPNILTFGVGRGAFSADMIGAILGVSPVYASGGAATDLGRYLWELRQVTDVYTSSFPNDTLAFQPALSFTPSANVQKLWIDYQITVNRNGILVSNGRKFWLLQGGVYYQVMDLGSDAYLGSRWKGTQVGSDRIMLTCDKYPPRLFFFRSSLPTTATADASTYAGLGSPVKPPTLEPDYTEPPVAGNNPSWQFGRTASGTGNLSAGDYRVMIRAVNAIDASESRMVKAWSSADVTMDAVTALATEALKVWSQPFSSARAPCPYDPKWTHFEIWRTEADGAEFFLEGVIPVVAFNNEWRSTNMLGSNFTNNSLIAYDETGSYERENRVSDANLNRRTSLLVNDLLAGYRPPVCAEAVNLQGVTICAGKAASDANPAVTAHSYMFFFNALGSTYTHATKRIAYVSGGAVFAGYTDYTAGDTVVIVSSFQGVSGEFPIASKVSDSTLELSAPGPGQDLTNVRGYIRRPHSTPSQKIASDEDVWYSRTDKYAPESFMLRTLNLSRSGDVFRGMRAVGRYAAVIMADGVHLLYLTTNISNEVVLEKHTVASSGAGTPWEDSICTWERNVAWANAKGAWVLITSDDADDTGARGKIVSLDKGAMRQWFEDAYRLGQSIDAGVDTHNECVRFRRHIDANTFQVWQINYRTGQGTLLDDDSGLLYVRSLYADSSQVVDPLLYSVNADGSVFEVNHYGLTHPYDGKTVQAVASVANGYTVTTTSISKTGVFSAAMLGDVVRFRSSTSGVNGVARLITAADTNSITFAAVTGLAAGDEFIIGATRFRFRSSPYRGSSPHALKTINGMIARARPGPRATAGNWGVPSGTPLTVRCYRDHYDGSADNEQLLELPVYEESDLTKTDQDKVSALTGQGTALEIEVECLESRADFLVESMFPDVREDGAESADQSTAA